MWLIHQLKYIFNSTFESLLVKSPGKVKFYILFFVIFGSLSLILALGISWSFIEFKYPNMDLDSMFFNGNIDLLINMINSVSVVIVVFLVNHYKNLDESGKGQFSISKLLQSTDPKVWLFYFATVLGISLYYCFFYFSDTAMVESPNDLQFLLNTMGEPGNLYLEFWKDSLIWYSLMYVPIVFISFNIIGQKLGKINAGSIASHWKHILTFILIVIIVSAVYISIYNLIDSLVLGLIRVPFVENYIPGFITLIFIVVINAAYYMVLSKMAYYCFFSTEEVKFQYAKEENEDLLDQ